MDSKGTVPNQPQDYTAQWDTSTPWNVNEDCVVSPITETINHRSQTKDYVHRGARRSGGIAAFVHDKPGTSGRK
jgi:hypothetical protein